MVSHEHKSIFIHIPKCAGTSIENALGHLDSHEGRGGQDHRGIRLIEKPFPNYHVLRTMDNAIEMLRRIKYYKVSNSIENPKNRLLASKLEYGSYYKFAFVRNPWARAYSWYRNVIRDKHLLKAYAINPEIEFHHFLNSFVGRGMLRPQTYWLKSFSGNIELDFIGRFESLNADFRVVTDALGLPDLQLPHKLDGGSTSYLNAYSRETKNIVSEFYKEEIDLFGYKFDGVISEYI